jgi:type III restriction enzyme
MQLMEYQNKAVDDLCEGFKDLWRADGRQLELMFKAPTGSGKTIMMADFLLRIDENHFMNEVEKAYIWISFGGDDSYTQSKNKLHDYYDGGTKRGLKDIGNLNERELLQNNIYFTNWSKIRGTNKDSKKLRKPTEHTSGNYGEFDEYIINTKRNRDFVLIVDEAHTETNTTLAQEVIDLIDPKIIIKITATPKTEPTTAQIQQNKARMVEVDSNDVITSGLVKEKIIVQDRESLEYVIDGDSKNKELDEDYALLDLAISKRNTLKSLYQNKGLDINPLVMIQLPNDMDKLKEYGEDEKGEKLKKENHQNKKDIVLDYLITERKVPEENISIWLSGNQTNFDDIVKNNSNIHFLLFKAAAATGWDCPRASILVMYREIKTPTFKTQIIGRIRRMPEAKHYQHSPALNYGYIFTNYNKNDIREAEKDNRNKLTFESSGKNLDRLKLDSIYFNRIDQNTLSPRQDFQEVLVEVFNKNQDKIKQEIDLTKSEVDRDIIVNLDIYGFSDNEMGNEILDSDESLNQNLSDYDLGKAFNYRCYDILNEQEEYEAKYNSSRSWSPLKSAMKIWFESKILELKIYKQNIYPIIVYDLNKPNSLLKRLIRDVLIEFRQYQEKSIYGKERREKVEVFVPPKNHTNPVDYELVPNIEKNIYKEFYLSAKYKGRDNEISFIELLEDDTNINWWHKQDDSGKNVFAVEYKQDNRDRLFYPDFIFLSKSNVLYIVDTKDGFTKTARDTELKHNALQNWIKDKKVNGVDKVIGGIAVKNSGIWQINISEKYQDNNWIDIDFK